MRKVIKASSLDDKKRLLEDLFDEIDLTDDEWIGLWNSCAPYVSMPEVFSMNNIDEILLGRGGYSLLEVIDSLDSKFDSQDQFFYISDQDFITSFSDINEVACPIDFNLVIDTILDTNDSFGIDEIQEILNEN